MEVTGQMVYVDNDVHESDMHVDNPENVFQMCFPPSNQDVFQTVGEGNIHDEFKENNGEESVGFDTVALDIHENENDLIVDGNVVPCVEKSNGLHRNAKESAEIISIPLDTLQSVEHLPPQEEQMDIEVPTNALFVSSQYNVESPGEERNQLQTTAGVSCPHAEHSSPSVSSGMENTTDISPTTLAESGESNSSFNLDKCDDFMDEVKLFFLKCKNFEKTYSFEAVTSPETTKDSEVEDENPLAPFSMELYRKSSNFRPNPERIATVGKTLKLSASKGPTFYNSQSSYCRHLFNHVYNLTAEAQRLKMDILHISHLTPWVLKFVPIEKDDLLYLCSQLEAILGENYFDASTRHAIQQKICWSFHTRTG